MLRQIEGSRGVAEGVARCRPEVICAYPISPQTHIVEALSTLVKSGELAPCESSTWSRSSPRCRWRSALGDGAYTATASQGLLYMAEPLYNASGLGLPIVMTVTNRAIGAPINVWNDHSDSISQRDSGWIQEDKTSSAEMLPADAPVLNLNAAAVFGGLAVANEPGEAARRKAAAMAGVI
ncbi:pyruvate flavodoxin/ferredoxin oxidoreductase-like protein [Kribbella orskensis]|uniref:Pyruvate flavodoxin/ferredoxin oxidoreductase-like protein n=1 Tax=Kribbella orskensis TaxID=2512216 RepID=A0ABY2B8G0_9ACTN|nr:MULTISPECIES: hypothetical protein [Kribbella]TCN31165.1 pyruvate flavodoxin/ferredoxin oxidoreductase-like protein [Kribbella sp. VKM Ac-2500]TCO11671.1 pyruvate flavodoxin/ferredoxin oxidoreductase-like protein [Kribbella orskensis]